MGKKGWKVTDDYLSLLLKKKNSKIIRPVILKRKLFE